jgi:hypothetical protein
LITTQHPPAAPPVQGGREVRAGGLGRAEAAGAAGATEVLLAEAAEDGDDLAEDLGLVPVDRVEGGVVGEELDVAAPA